MIVHRSYYDTLVLGERRIIRNPFTTELGNIGCKWIYPQSVIRACGISEF